MLVVASLIVLACLQRETKKFEKRLNKAKADSKEELVRDVHKLDSIMARYVHQFLGQGILEKLANSYADGEEDDKLKSLRFEQCLLVN